MKLVFSAEARFDLLRIGDTIAQDSPRRAKTFVAELRQRCEALLDHPLAYPVVSRSNTQDLRRLVHGSYLIFYQVKLSHIVIVRILSARMNVTDILGLTD